MKTRLLSLVWTSIALSGIAVADTTLISAKDIKHNFRFALPENYQPKDMQSHPRYHGNVLVWAPVESSLQLNQFRQLRLLVLTDSAASQGYDSSVQGLRAYAQSVLQNIESGCASNSIHLTAQVQVKQGVAFDWRQVCVNGERGEDYRVEQGRLFISELGVFGLSQFGYSTRKINQIPEVDRNWFAKFSFNSDFCHHQMDCGHEGYFQEAIKFKSDQS
ncbi:MULTISPECIES: hypothetical protein [Nitrincola]|uniref:Uncharacterized protein n=1 Tax=Nitrincola nitratireducens TaxID=1229521 RepID=W9UV30_9GAMM|nr:MULTISPECIES: hypothetical protein [Nitrincola]EXJ10919.1 hypothetical protein D791_02017 [Nitrincola nitratireducens]